MIVRFPNRLHRFIFFTVHAGDDGAPIVNTVPLYTLMQRIRGVNTRWAMILLLAANCMPLTTFFIRGLYQGHPRQFEEAAIIDGCSWFSAFWRIIFPQLKPITATAVIMNCGIHLEQLWAGDLLFAKAPGAHHPHCHFHLFFKPTGQVEPDGRGHHSWHDPRARHLSAVPKILYQGPVRGRNQG